MKTKHLFPVLFAAGILALNFSARADRDDYGQGDCQTNGYCETNGYCTNDCDINGSEQMYAVVILEPTTNAPSGSLGIAKINSDNYCGNESAAIDLKTFALTPGEYDLVVSLAAEGTNVTIGQFDVETNEYGGQGGCGGWRWSGGFGGSGGWGWVWGGQGGGCQQDCLGSGGGDNGGQWVPCSWGGFDNWGSWTNWSDTNFYNPNCEYTNFPVVTTSEFELPSGVNPTDIAEILVTDTYSNPYLVGDVTNPAPDSVINISATVRVMPGVAAPSATGTAHLQSTARKGKWTHQFSLAGSGFTAKSMLEMKVNGKISGAALASKSGAVTIKKLPSHTPALRSLLLLNKKGAEAASAQF